MCSIDKSLKEYDFLDVQVDSQATIVKQINNNTLGRNNLNIGIDITSYLKVTQIDIMKQSIINDFILRLMKVGETSNVNLDIKAYINRMNRENNIRKLLDKKFLNKKISLNVGTCAEIIYDKITEICEYISPNLIIMNTSMGSLIENKDEFIPSHNECSLSLKRIGNICNCNIYIDYYMPWDDNRILIANSDCVVRHNDNESFNDTLTEFSFGYDIELNNTTAKVLNVIIPNELSF